MGARCSVRTMSGCSLFGRRYKRDCKNKKRWSRSWPNGERKMSPVHEPSDSSASGERELIYPCLASALLLQPSLIPMVMGRLLHSYPGVTSSPSSPPPSAREPLQRSVRSTSLAQLLSEQ